MAKRTRYPSRTAGKAPARRAARPDSPALPAAGGEEHPPYPHEHLEDGTVVASRGGLTEAEVQRAAQLEAEATAKEKAAIAESLRRRNRGQAEDFQPTGDVNAPLSVRAAH